MDTSLHPVAKSRLSLRIAVGAMFFMAGLSFASWASRIPAIQQSLHLSEAGLGGVLLAIPTGLMCSLPFTGWVITKIGSRKLLVISITCYAILLVGLGAARSVYELLGCLFLYGFAGNAANIAVNTQAVATEKLYAKPIMASFHGIWSMAGFTGAGIGIFMIGQHIIPLYHFLGIMVLLIIGVIITSRNLDEDCDARVKDEVVVLSIRDRIRSMTPLLKLGIIAFCSMICEGTMFDWSGVYFKKVILAHNGWIGAGYFAFMCTMALGRFTADWFAGVYGLRRTLILSGSLTATGLVVAVAFPYLWPAIIGFMLVGAGVSSVVPMIYSSAGKTTIMSPGVALTAVSTIGFSGFLIGPPLIGFIAGIATLRASFLLIACMGMSVAIISSRTKLN
ncbi:MFS transporter [Mucilaginibacter sp.]|uniref:MFS transporter n=1 Tax=Mucilaginibacter sp. TaxID=1882438 RepID=UPI002C2C3DB3|nr:MFS transporter [Mucilaginibacter sp.]HTI58285.1 MFS transporter [Mucilaginibacter sp.]